VRDSDTTWTRQADLPLVSPSGKRKKAKDGAGGAMAGNTLYALKGGNTLEFYAYDLFTGDWQPLEDVGIPTGVPRKRVKGGGSLTYSAFLDGLFALVGNNSNEFWFYARSGSAGGGAQAGESLGTAGAVMRLTPNPATGRVQLTWPQCGPPDGRAGRAPAQLTVFDIAGRQVLKLGGVGQQFELDTRHLATGIYLLQIETSTSRTTGRLQVVH